MRIAKARLVPYCNFILTKVIFAFRSPVHVRQAHSDFNKSVFDVLEPLCYRHAHTLAEMFPLRQASTTRVR